MSNIMNYSFLFSNSSSSPSSGFGSYSWLSEYNNIRNGTYYKVLKAYYAKTRDTSDSTDKSSSTKKTNTVSEAKSEAEKLQSDASSLVSAADALITKGTDSLFNMKDITVKGEDGTETTTRGYDTDAIYSAVSKFVSSYNTLLEGASSSSSKTIQNQAINMANSTKSYEKLLDKIGITIGSNNKLTLDESKFKAADMTTVKTLFNGNSSFAYSASSRASMISASAKSEANKNSLYTSSGKYNNYSTGNLLDSIF